MSGPGLPFVNALAATRAAQGDLSGTLAGEEGALTQLEAAQQEVARQLAERTAAAQQTAQAASSQYQEAAAAPPPGFLPGDTFVPQILGALASVIGQSPQFSQQAEEGIAQRRATLLKSRAENLQALRDQYLEKAKAAEDAGDFETATSVRQKYETASKNVEVVLQNAQRADRLVEAERDRNAARDRQAEEIRARLKLQELRGQQEKEQIRLQAEEARKTQAAPRTPSVVKYEGTGKRAAGGGTGSTASNVAVLNANQHATRRTAIANRVSMKKINRKAALSNLKTFDLNTRVLDESPVSFIARMQSIEDPTHPGKRLYTDTEIANAGRRLYTPEEQATQ